MCRAHVLRHIAKRGTRQLAGHALKTPLGCAMPGLLVRSKLGRSGKALGADRAHARHGQVSEWVCDPEVRDSAVL